MSKLVIVESPAKAKTINRYLGQGYVVRASMGHVRDLPKSKIGVDIEHDFAPSYTVLPDRKKLIAELKEEAGKAEEIYLATDLDREGEAIAWHLAEALNLPAKKVRRVVFNEITKNAIRAAFEQPQRVNLNKVNAQQARRILDRIVGYKLSPLLWAKLHYGLSAGRVQSVAVRLIVNREREIEAFKPQEYWEIEAELAPEKHLPHEPKTFRAKLVRLADMPSETHETPGDEAPEGGEEEAPLSEPSIANQAEAERIVAELRAAEFRVGKVNDRERLQRPWPPFNTSSLQQQASVQLHFSTKKTMTLAQQLYEGIELGAEGATGLITYMRTDSLRVADQAIAQCRAYLGAHFPPEYLPEKPNFYRSSKEAQGAHEAIRPTDVTRTPEEVKPYLEKDLFRLYELIWKRFVASQMPPGRLAIKDVEVDAGRAVFAVQGKRLVFDGHLRVSGWDPKQELLLPTLRGGERLDLLDLDPTQHFTKPPPRYSEATLVKTLEKLGIGRPSTYSPIISTVQQRQYVRLLKRQFHATELGKLVTDQLVAHFADIMDVGFTSGMEDRLDEVEEGRTDWLDALRAFYGPFAADLAKAEENMQRPEPETTEFKCRECGKPMLKRMSRRGPFLGCSGYPECRFTMNLDAEGNPSEKPKAEPTDEKCEKCGAPMVIRTGRHGRFMACSGYPKCRNTRNIEGADASAPVVPPELKTCDKCGAEMVLRRSRRGPFLGCSAYPKCKNAKPLPKEGKKDGPGRAE